MGFTVFRALYFCDTLYEGVVKILFLAWRRGWANFGSKMCDVIYECLLNRHCPMKNYGRKENRESQPSRLPITRKPLKLFSIFKLLTVTYLPDWVRSHFFVPNIFRIPQKKTGFYHLNLVPVGNWKSFLLFKHCSAQISSNPAKA